MFTFLRANPWQLAFDGEDDAAAAAAAAAATAAAEAEAAAAAALAAEGKTFSQAEVNTFLAAEKRKDQDKQRALAGELVVLKREKNLTDKQRGDLQKRIDDLQAQYLTTEEKARQESERVQKEYDEQLRVTTIERDDWKVKHEQLTINTEIAAAAIEHNAVHFEQIAAILSPKAKSTEKLNEEGQPTGEFEPRVSFRDKDKDEKPIILELTIDDAVKRMRELPQYANLFHTKQKGGLGSSGSETTRGKVDLAKIAREDPKEYRRLRKEQPELFG